MNKILLEQDVGKFWWFFFLFLLIPTAILLLSVKFPSNNTSKRRLICYCIFAVYNFFKHVHIFWLFAFWWSDVLLNFITMKLESFTYPFEIPISPCFEINIKIFPFVHFSPSLHTKHCHILNTLVIFFLFQK